MRVLREALLSIFLGALCVTAVKVALWVDRIDPVLTELEATVRELRGAAREQRSYYKATGKALFIATRDFARLVQATDERMEVLAAEAQRTLRETTKTISVAGEATGQVGKDSHALAAAAVRELEQTAAESRAVLAAAGVQIEALEELRRPLAATFEGTAKATSNLAEGSESIKIALAPLRKAEGRLKMVLKWLLGLVKVNVR